MDINTYLWIVLNAGVLALIFAFIKTNWINKQDQGTDKMEQIGKSIAEGSMAFLRAEYRVLGFFVLIVALLLGFANAGRQDSSAFISLSFIAGALASQRVNLVAVIIPSMSNMVFPEVWLISLQD